MYLAADFLCWFPKLHCFLSDNAGVGFGCKNKNQKILSTKPNTLLGKKVGQETFEKYWNNPKKCLCSFKNKKTYAFTEKVQD